LEYWDDEIQTTYVKAKTPKELEQLFA
jgi:hypothetical protein